MYMETRWTSIRFLFIFMVVFVMFFFAMISKVGAQGFSDVNENTDHYGSIKEATELKFMSGYPDGRFDPYAQLPRGNVVKALGKYVIETSGGSINSYDISGVKPFNDVPPTYRDQELYRYSLIVKKAGVFEGSKNNLMPNRLINRQQMAKVLVKAFDLEPIPGVEPIVTDLNKAEKEFREYISILSQHSVTNVTKFNPNSFTTRGQFATFLVNSHKVQTGEMVTPTPEEEERAWQEAQEKRQADIEKLENERKKQDEAEPIPLTVKEMLPVSYYVPFKGSLPKTVPVIYSDGKEKEHNVVWDTKGIDFTKPGDHEVTGIVTGTNFEATLSINLFEFKIFPIYRPIYMIPTKPVEPETSHAKSLMDKLPNDVKNAANAIIANQIWQKANDAVNEVRYHYPSYDVSAWTEILLDQKAIIEQWQTDINRAKTAVNVAVNEVVLLLKQIKSVEEIQPIIDNAYAKLTNYRNLDRRADVKDLDERMYKYQLYADDLKIVYGALSELDFRVHLPDSDVPFYTLLMPQDKRLDVSWVYPVGSGYLDYDKKDILRDTRLIGGKVRYIDVLGYISKGSVTVAKGFYLSVPPKYFSTFKEVSFWRPSLYIYIDE